MPFQDSLCIGSCLNSEDCVQVGTENYEILAKAQCKRLIEAIRAELGSEPEGANLKIKSCLHDFGTYYEVYCWFDPESPAATTYAYDAERFVNQ